MAVTETIKVATVRVCHISTHMLSLFLQGRLTDASPVNLPPDVEVIGVEMTGERTGIAKMWLRSEMWQQGKDGDEVTPTYRRDVRL